MSRIVHWVQRHRLTTFFVLAYAVSWTPWAFHSAGMSLGTPFFPGGPLVAALVVIAIAEGRPGFRELGSRLIRWRVGWVWYVVAVGLPTVLVLVTGLVNSWLGAPAPDFSSIVWADVGLVLALRMVTPTDSALGEEPGFRGYALPHLQDRLSPLTAAGVLGLLTAGWHFPLVPLGNLGWIGLPSTVAITYLYVWVFNRTGGSLLMTMLFHASQGAFTFGMLGFTGADEERAAFVYFGVLVIAVSLVVGLDRAAWRRAPAGAVHGHGRVRRRAGAAVAAVLLLGGCGGERSATESAPSDLADGSAAERAPSTGDEDFCARAAGIDDRVDAALSDLEDDGPSVPRAFHQIAEELRAMDAPASVSADWDALAGGLDRMADAFADIDISDPHSLATLDEAEGDLTRASTMVEDYLRDHCSIGYATSSRPTG
jgi:membrane protease YdiL (CAAX protease family)